MKEKGSGGFLVMPLGQFLQSLQQGTKDNGPYS